MITVEWWNSTDFANTLYSRGFKNKVILDTYLGLPELVEIIIGDSDGEGGVIPSFQRRSKEYRFEVFVPEFMVDALTDIRLHDNINVTDHNGTVFPVTNRNSWEVGSGQWIGNGCTKQVTISFQTGERVIRTNCPDNNCGSDSPTCRSYLTVSDIDIFDPTSTWKELNLGGITVNLALQSILITDKVALEDYLNTLGYGTFAVTGTSTEVIITNVQSTPAIYHFLNISLTDPGTGTEPIYPFSSDC